MSKRKEKREKKKEQEKLEKRAKKVEKKSKRQLRRAKKTAATVAEITAERLRRAFIGQSISDVPAGFQRGDLAIIMAPAMNPERLAKIRADFEEQMRGPRRRELLLVKKPGSAVSLKALKRQIKKGG